jgi:hypothetical protein
VSSTKGTLLLIAGAVLGAVAGFAASNLSSTPTETETAIAHAKALERDLAVERAGRASERAAREEAVRQSEAAREAAQRDVAVLRERLAAADGTGAVASTGATSASAPGAERTPAAPASSGGAKSEESREERAKARLRTIGPDVEAALAAKDLKKMTELLEELAKLGREGWPHVARLAVAAAQAAAAHPEAGAGLFRALTAFPDLYEDAINGADRWEPAFRHLAVGYFPYTGRDPKNELFVKRLATEPDESVGQAIAGMVSFARDPRVAPGLVTALAQQPSAKIRLKILGALAEAPGDEARKGLEAAARTDADPEVRRAAEFAARSRDANQVGFFVTYVAPDSALGPSGIREGDIVTSARGTVLLSIGDVWKVWGTVAQAPKEPCPVVVSRAGATFHASLTAEQVTVLFQSGRCVRPDEK